MVGNSDLPPRQIAAPWIERADLIIAADGGANRLLALGWEPDLVVGDMDSVLGSTRRRLGRRRFKAMRDPNRTDLEKALGVAHDRGCRDVSIFGVSKGRLDHVLGAVSILLAWTSKFRLRLVDEDFTTEVVRRKLRFRAPPGTVVSLWAPSGAKGVDTRGLKWRLKGATLRRGTLGIHNFVEQSPVIISVAEGDLLVMRGHWVEPHGR